MEFDIADLSFGGVKLLLFFIVKILIHHEYTYCLSILIAKRNETRKNVFVIYILYIIYIITVLCFDVYVT